MIAHSHVAAFASDLAKVVPAPSLKDGAMAILFVLGEALRDSGVDPGDVYIAAGSAAQVVPANDPKAA